MSRGRHRVFLAASAAILTSIPLLDHDLRGLDVLLRRELAISLSNSVRLPAARIRLAVPDAGYRPGARLARGAGRRGGLEPSRCGVR